MYISDIGNQHGIYSLMLVSISIPSYLSGSLSFSICCPFCSKYLSSLSNSKATHSSSWLLLLSGISVLFFFSYFLFCLSLVGTSTWPLVFSHVSLRFSICFFSHINVEGLFAPHELTQQIPVTRILFSALSTFPNCLTFLSPAPSFLPGCGQS